MKLLPLPAVQPWVKEALESSFLAVLSVLRQYLPLAKYLVVASPRAVHPVSTLAWDLQCQFAYTKIAEPAERVT